MKSLKAVLVVLFAAAFVFACGVGIAADKKAPAAEKAPAAAAEGDAADGKEVKKGPPKGEVLYQAEFEEEDDTDAFSSDNAEIEWQKGGANGSKGCLKCFTPDEGGLVAAEKYVQWYDAKTFVDWDYNVTGFTDEFYLLASAAKAGSNVRVQVKGWVKGKWAHAQVKAGNMSQVGKSGKNDTFRNMVFVVSGVDKECKDPSMLIDNIVVTATDKKKEEAVE